MGVQQPNVRQRHRVLNLPAGQAEIWLEEAGSQTAMYTVHPNGAGNSVWKRCDVIGCLGEAVIQETKCLRHAERPLVLSYLASLGVSGEGFGVSLRGVQVSRELWNTIFSSPIVRGRELLVPIDLTGADVEARIWLDGCRLKTILLNGAIVREGFQLNHCEFMDQLSADYTFFNAGPPSFIDVVFHNSVYISYAHTERVSIGFSDCQFEAQFMGDGMSGSLFVERSHFERDLHLKGAKCEALVLTDCTIEGALEVEGARFGLFRVPNLRTTSTYRLGPICSENDISLERAEFRANVAMTLESKILDMSGTQFPRGGQLHISASKVNLNQVVSGGPLLIAGENRDRRPVVVSIQGADAGQMTLSNVDMSSCFFYGARGLETVTLEPSVKLAPSPAGFDTTRRCIADEFAWRAHCRKWFAKIWEVSWDRIVGEVQGKNGSMGGFHVPELHASQVASVYRDLRHSFEAKRDLTNAADFYYGEMEMRRHNHLSTFSERIVISLYWIISGYGLYATRALLCLLIAVLLGAWGLSQFGFAHRSSFMESSSVLISLSYSRPAAFGESDFCRRVDTDCSIHRRTGLGCIGGFSYS